MFNFHHLMQIVWLLVSLTTIRINLRTIFLFCNRNFFVLIFIATSQPFGSIGGGTLYLLRLDENGSINETKTFDSTDGLFDVVSIALRN